MYQVLVPVDLDEDRALAQARFVADLPTASENVQATLLFVFTGDQEELPDELQQFKSGERIGSVRRSRETLEEAGVSVSVFDESGDPEDIITRYAAEEDPDLIVLGGRKRSPVGKAIFGSVAQSVILNTDRPVAVTGAGEPGRT